MKQLRLLAPELDGPVQIDFQREALWINSERYPKLVRFRAEQGVWTLDDPSNSGTLHIVANIRGVGECVLHTSILMLRNEPYRLLVELARGQANRLRNLLAEWERDGWQIPKDAFTTIRDLAGQLCQAVQSTNHATAETTAAVLIQQSTKLGDQIVVDHARDMLQHRLQRGDRPAIGCVLRSPREQPSAIRCLDTVADDVAIPIDWSRIEKERGVYDWTALDKQVEWACDAGLEPTIGPVLDFRPGRLPKWIEQSKNDPSTLLTLLIDVAETVVGRYAEQVESWIVTTGTNSNQSLGLSVDQAEWLTARLVDAARQIEPTAQLAVGLDQPWGWYVGSTTKSTWPVEFADGLLRTGARPSAILLHIDAGFQEPNRSAADFSKLLDRFRRLNLPLWIELTAPSVDRAITPPACARDRQAEWIETQVLASLAKPFVKRVNWGEFRDDATSQYPDGGLLDANATPKPALAKLAAIHKIMQDTHASTTPKN